MATSARILTSCSDGPRTNKESHMKTDTIKPRVIALVMLAVTVGANAANAATKLSTSGCCPLCK